MSALPEQLIENPGGSVDEDVLSGVLRSIRLSGSLQFCFMPSGDWETDGRPRFSEKAGRPVTPFHILVAGDCWLQMPDRRLDLVAGDIVAFPFGTGHKIGHGAGGQVVAPVADLPPKPWREIPTLRYGEGRSPHRLLCGYLRCDAMDFRPLRMALPQLLHMKTAGPETHWLRATIAQIVAEVDRPRTGGMSMLERLSEVIFIELLRHEILVSARAGAMGWLAALADPPLARCLALIHDDPHRAWSIASLAKAAGFSRSTLGERFERIIGTSPMRYVRDWRLYLASVALRSGGRAIADIGHDAGYGTEAAFNRAFARAYGAPPAAWRQKAKDENP